MFFFEILNMGEIMEKRDELKNRTAKVYSNSLRTDSKSYKETIYNLIDYLIVDNYFSHIIKTL